MILAVIQARFSSSRLPGKVMKDLLGEPMLFRQIERVLRSKMIGSIVVATSDDPSDDPIEVMCKEKGIAVFRGSLDDVLDRFYRASEPYSPDHVVRITGDCPLIDPAIIDMVTAKHLEEQNDYTSNTLVPTFPDGLDVEVMTFDALKVAWRSARLSSEREHVTPFIYKNQDNFKCANLANESGDLSKMRWTVDEPEDFTFIHGVYSRLYPVNPDFSTEEVLRLIEDHPEFYALNDRFERNEGYRRSLEKDVILDSNPD